MTAQQDGPTRGVVIRILGDAIFHVHAKDIRINEWIAARDGLLNTVPITEPGSRAWNYATLGLGRLRLQPPVRWL
jgi:sugar phosphate isomerase/epimerase